MSDETDLETVVTRILRFSDWPMRAQSRSFDRPFSDIPINRVLGLIRYDRNGGW